MKKLKRKYWKRRVYFEQYAPAPMAHYQYDIGQEYEDAPWITVDIYYKIVPDELKYLHTNRGKEFANFIKETLPGGRLVYDMLLMLYGIEFDSDETLTWFKLKYL